MNENNEITITEQAPQARPRAQLISSQRYLDAATVRRKMTTLSGAPVHHTLAEWVERFKQC